MNTKIAHLHQKTRIPLAIGPIHFVGIGGIGMSGIAEILCNLGYKVQGSDSSDNYNVKRLREKGIKVFIGHDAKHVVDAQVVVVSSAIKKDNAELVEARARMLPVVRRAEMLGELMRLKWGIAIGGTHGKTTTTSMVGALLEKAAMDPTVVNGGIINAYGTNVRLGEGDWMVVESDESDGSFQKLPATIAVVTNMDAEHMDHYGDFAAVRKAYDAFVTNIPFYGFAVLCLDHAEVQAMIPRVSDRRVVTYGFNAQADVRGANVETGPHGATFDVVFTDRKTGKTETLTGLMLPMFGKHNVQNCLAALAVGRELGVTFVAMREAFANFTGVKRRFTRTGEAHGVVVIDDYGHHPVEIAAVLSAAKSARGDKGRTIAVIQPHRFTRVQSLFEEFCTCMNEADAVIVSDIYPAGEAPIEGISKETLAEGLRTHGHRDVHLLANPEELPKLVASMAQEGDIVVCLGAGSITTWANALPGELEKLFDAADAQNASKAAR
jgi:UDP-N-acetylmuramate--alanine ligase